MRNLQRYLIWLLGLLGVASLVSCQFGGTLDSNQIAERSQIAKTSSAPTPMQQIPASEEISSDLIGGKRIELQDSARWIRMLRLSREWRFGLAILSPNGEWIVSDASQKPKSFEFLEIMTTEDENLMFTFQPEKSFGLMGYIEQSWSPDSTSFAYWGVDEPKPYCEHSRLVILQIDPINLSVNPASFELPGDESECATFTWSPDGSMLAVIPDPSIGEIYILDVTGQILDKILIPMVEDTKRPLGNLAWTTSNLFYSINYRLYQLDLSTHESIDVFEVGEWWVLGLDPTYSSRFLLTRRLSQFYDPTLLYPSVDEYAILDGETQEIFKLELENSTCRVFASTSKFTAFACNDPHEVWIYNWEDESLNNYGEYGRVLGWSDKYQGYLLLEGSEENPRIEALQP